MLIHWYQKKNLFQPNKTKKNAGDGAGVGKGRTVAGVIFENFQLGRNKAIWISVSNDLKYDAERDLEDIGAPYIEVHPLNKVTKPRFN